MVRVISKEDNVTLQQALREAEAQTSAEFAVVIARASDEYRAIALALGMVLGALVALGLWHFEIVMDFPLLLIVQCAVCALMLGVPFFRHLFPRLAPRRLLVHRAAQRAAAEYLHLTHQLPAAAPIVLLYVSLAERYVHIYSSRYVREKIPDSEWDEVVTILTSRVGSDGICDAVVSAVEHAAKMLKAIFPASQRVHTLSNIMEVID